ncbi:alkaline phosphatase D family protein [Aquihabitans sp. G128]|uniref:alkaline phosphatase D family protein n=1 Tax=Aquihabitans sp. G128 TaxID=2849779 RepID=UPI001C23EDFA|nr:alkaline phosphatase D family protein [Aquihabitans sp. G128]QXC62719.1 alkaline phosphatase D family protein [Aquihabitans sp. G128]
MAVIEPAPPGFPYGVASFEPTTSSVLLWTRAPDPSPVDWEVATDVGFTDVVASGRSSGTIEGDECTHVVDVTGLRPGTDHHYRFTAADGASAAGRTRTIAEGDRSVRLGLVCCGDYSAGHFAAYRALAEADIDLVVHLGDYVYAEVEGDLRPVEPDRDAVSRDDYRKRYAQVRSDPDLQALHQRHPMVAVIDDHDLADNAWEGGAKTHDPDEHGPWAPRRDAAAAERATWLPIRGDGPSERTERAQWRSVRLGDVAELVLLDTRLAGRDEQADDGGPALEDPDRTILGAAQGRWLAERVADRSLPWVVIVSSVVVNDMAIDLPADADVDEPFPSGYLVEDGRAINTDGWDGYPGERRRLVEALRQRGGGAVLLSGDVHSAWAFEGPTDDLGAVAVELTCPAVTSEPMGEMVPVVGRAVQHLLRAKPDVRWADLFARGHLIVEVDPTAVTGTWWFSDSEDPGSVPALQAGAAWRTSLDQPGRLVEVEVLAPSPRRARWRRRRGRRRRDRVAQRSGRPAARASPAAGDAGGGGAPAPPGAPGRGRCGGGDSRGLEPGPEALTSRAAPPGWPRAAEPPTIVLRPQGP